ncbi:MULTISPECIES: SDR family NAD(P)-dependent oxidoreductase [unclassified Caulobacter]|uniref:SDR family NAD(P)-dependent oxidoreductase n=1 Tax=unclassified Caulobacter TaxID=2648921 RepID=UPI000D396103|nr:MULTISPECIES: SDR family oxidoreductase [unclassified Caulobacter]PTS91361.1 NAD(P)-dependent oxidoreductase [Caulobacter sp. HMWF009]PTT12050.1 NAD(P)-dependent oxidoreductase [Caulobacter sp. HMWF025]PTT83750.1 NAD(P)-dependent oxidoreductase [Pseudomonas sp. HMWF010]
MTRALEGKIAVITGAAGAIGTATSRLMAERGATIVAVDMPGTDWSGLKAALPGDTRLVTAEADVTDEASVAAYVEKARAECGRIDVFFNNAGIEGPVQPIESYPLDAFMKVLGVNVAGVFLGLKHVLPVMYAQGSGSIINTSSVAGLTGAVGMAGYCTSKHAVIGVTRVAAVEAAPKGVRVNCVNPGPIESRMMQSINTGQSGDPKLAHDLISNAVPAKRYGTPEEVAGLVAFLASDDATYCNGGFYTVDGALTAA